MFRKKLPCIGYSLLYALIVSLCSVALTAIYYVIDFVLPSDARGLFPLSRQMETVSATALFLTVVLYRPFKKLAGGGWLHKLTVLVGYVFFEFLLVKPVLVPLMKTVYEGIKNATVFGKYFTAEVFYVKTVAFALLLLVDTVGSLINVKSTAFKPLRHRFKLPSWLTLSFVFVFTYMVLSRLSLRLNQRFFLRVSNNKNLFFTCFVRAVVLVAVIMLYYWLAKRASRRLLYSSSVLAVHFFFGDVLIKHINMMMNTRLNVYVLANLIYRPAEDIIYYVSGNDEVWIRCRIILMFFLVEVILMIKNKLQKRKIKAPVTE